MERYEVTEPGAHRTQLGYYGGPADGRVSRLACQTENQLSAIADGAVPFGYTVTRYGVHNDKTLCWVLFMHTPIMERGKL